MPVNAHARTVGQPLLFDKDERVGPHLRARIEQMLQRAFVNHHGASNRVHAPPIDAIREQHKMRTEPSNAGRHRNHLLLANEDVETALVV